MDSNARGSAGKVRPFVLLPASKLQALAHALTQPLAEWAKQWGLDASALALDCVAATPSLAPPSWQRSYGSAGQMAWLAWPQTCSARLQSAMFGADISHSADSIAHAAAQAALEELAQALVKLAGLERSDLHPLAPACLAYASGAVHVQLRLDGQHAMDCLFEHGSLKACLASLNLAANTSAKAVDLPPLVARTRALGKESVRLIVQAGQAEVSVGNLFSLAVGDVIRFQHPIDAPLPVLTEQGMPVFDGFLGVRDKHMALELLPHTTN